MIAIALCCNPQVLIADEPTTALDVTIQAQILDLMLELKEKLGTAIILITHDLGVVAETCERVIVMYAGRMVEQATGRRAVRAAAASLHARAAARAAAGRRRWRRWQRSAEARGNPGHRARPEPADRRLRLRAALRASRSTAAATAAPALVEAERSHLVACWEAQRVAEAAA